MLWHLVSNFDFQAPFWRDNGGCHHSGALWPVHSKPNQNFVPRWGPCGSLFIPKSCFRTFDPPPLNYVNASKICCIISQAFEEFIFVFLKVIGKQYKINMIAPPPPPYILRMLIFTFRERSQMTSSKIRGFQTPSPPPSSSVIFAIPPPLDDVIFYQPHPPFPNMIFGKIFFMVKLQNQDLAMNIIQKLA